MSSTDTPAKTLRCPPPPDTHIVSQHQSSGLDHKLVGLLVSDHSCCETCSTAGLPAGVHRPGAELLHMPETHRFRHQDLQNHSKECNTDRIRLHSPTDTSCSTYFRNWLLAVLGSPTMQTLMSPLSEVPSVVVLGTPPNSISRMPRFTSSFPAQTRVPFIRLEGLWSKVSWL